MLPSKDCASLPCSSIVISGTLANVPHISVSGLRCVKVKVFVYSPDIPVGSADFILITSRYRNSLFYSLISLGKIQRIVCTCSHS